MSLTETSLGRTPPVLGGSFSTMMGGAAGPFSSCVRHAARAEVPGRRRTARDTDKGCGAVRRRGYMMRRRHAAGVIWVFAAPSPR
eukprot:scaffold12865_cov71-Phaeocystis_antarctica.AAC.2